MLTHSAPFSPLLQCASASPDQSSQYLPPLHLKEKKHSHWYWLGRVWMNQRLLLEGWIEDLHLSFSCDWTWQPSYSIWNSIQLTMMMISMMMTDYYYPWSTLNMFLFWSGTPETSCSDVFSFVQMFIKFCCFHLLMFMDAAFWCQ